MQATFVGHPDRDTRDDNGQTRFYGLTFVRNVPVDVSHLSDMHKAKLRGNGHFRVTEATPKAAAAPKPEPKAAAAAPTVESHPAMTPDALAKREARAAKKAAKAA